MSTEPITSITKQITCPQCRDTKITVCIAEDRVVAIKTETGTIVVDEDGFFCTCGKMFIQTTRSKGESPCMRNTFML